MYIQDFVLNNPQGLICHETQPTNIATKYEITSIFCLCTKSISVELPTNDSFKTHTYLVYMYIKIWY